MLRRVPRFLRVALLTAVALAVGASIFQSWMAGTPGAAGYVQTQWGPLGPADRDLLIKVRLAGLWEGPTGEQAETQAGRTEVQQVGSNLHNEHQELDQITRDTAAQLGVILPSRPTAEQLGWMNEISALQGTQYDQVFVQRLRAAHGSVLPAIANVRAGTRNELVRQFAETADTFVTRHIGYLEGTGLVDYTALPEAPSPGLLSGQSSPLDLVVPGLVVLAALLATYAFFSALRPKKKKPSADAQRTPRKTRADASLATGRAIAAIAVPEQRDAPVTAVTADAVASQPFTVPPATTESPSGRWIRPGADTGPHAMHPGMPTEMEQTFVYSQRPEPVPTQYTTVADYPPVGHGYPQAAGGWDYDDSPETPAHGIPMQGDGSPLASPVSTGAYRVNGTGAHPVSATGSHRVTDTGPRHSVRR